VAGAFSLGEGTSADGSPDGADGAAALAAAEGEASSDVVAGEAVGVELPQADRAKAIPRMAVARPPAEGARREVVRTKLGNETRARDGRRITPES
jgi:hypothetical protein